MNRHCQASRKNRINSIPCRQLSKSNRHIIFDLDGTLVDTAPDLINTLNHILARENHPPAPEPLMRTMISEGARAMLVKGFELAGAQKSAQRNMMT